VFLTAVRGWGPLATVRVWIAPIGYDLGQSTRFGAYWFYVPVTEPYERSGAGAGGPDTPSPRGAGPLHVALGPVRVSSLFGMNVTTMRIDRVNVTFTRNELARESLPLKSGEDVKGVLLPPRGARHRAQRHFDQVTTP